MSQGRDKSCRFKCDMERNEKETMQLKCENERKERAVLKDGLRLVRSHYILKLDLLIVALTGHHKF
jgi:hypothetical protein